MSDTDTVRLREAIVHQLVAPDLPLDDDEWSRGYRQAFWWVLHHIDHPPAFDGQVPRCGECDGPLAPDGSHQSEWADCSRSQCQYPLQIDGDR